MQRSSRYLWKNARMRNSSTTWPKVWWRDVSCGWGKENRNPSRIMRTPNTLEVSVLEALLSRLWWFLIPEAPICGCPKWAVLIVEIPSLERRASTIMTRVARYVSYKRARKGWNDSSGVSYIILCLLRSMQKMELNSILPTARGLLAAFLVSMAWLSQTICWSRNSDLQRSKMLLVWEWLILWENSTVFSGWALHPFLSTTPLLFLRTPLIKVFWMNLSSPSISATTNQANSPLEDMMKKNSRAN